jgi:hypothetical protein
MTEAHLGRLLSASLHQAITETLPQRIEFYENWLHWEALREGGIGLAPMTAVLGFLRTEGDAYDQVMIRAGELSAEWAVASISPFRLRRMAWLPRTFRLKAVLRLADEIARAISTHSPLVRRVRGTSAEVRIGDSVFCASREAHTMPLCGFYRALISRTLQLSGVEASTRIESCRAVDGSPCVVRVDLAEIPAIAS